MHLVFVGIASLPALQGGSNSRITFSIFERIPKAGLSLHLDFGLFLGPIFYMWVLGFMLPGKPFFQSS